MTRPGKRSFREAAIAGIGHTEFSKKSGRSELTLAAECAKAALFLVSDYAGAVTGAALDVNGGEFLPR